MNIHSGGLMAYLNNKTQQQAAATNMNNDTQEGGITQIDVHNLVRNDRNFYGVRDIEALASMIAASGVVEPLIVTPIGDGKYRIVAGERRASATLLRLERGDLIDPKLPCIVKTFTGSGSLDESDMEMLCLIVSNRGQRQTRTAMEKLKEIEELEPIVKKIYKDENIQGSFRKFFADNLSISDAQLQRLKRLVNLIPDGQKALEIGILSDTAAMELANYTEDEQLGYLQALFEDNIQNRVRDIKEFFGMQQESDPSENELDEDETDENKSTHQPAVDKKPDSSLNKEKSLKENHPEKQQDHHKEQEIDSIPQVAAVKNKEKERPHEQPSALTTYRTAANATVIDLDIPIPKDMNREQIEHEADTWIETILKDSIRIAEEKIAEARKAGETRIAALWDSRRAKAVLVLSTARNE